MPCIMLISSGVVAVNEIPALLDLISWGIGMFCLIVIKVAGWSSRRGAVVNESD